VLLYHGTMIIRNPAWSEIVSLRRPLTNEVQKARIVSFLVDAYPAESGTRLRELFEERRTRAVDPFLAALVRGLVIINDLPAPEPPIPDYIRIDAALREERLALQAAAAMEQGLVSPAHLVVDTFPSEQGSQRVKDAATLYKAKKKSSRSAPPSPSTARSRARR